MNTNSKMKKISLAVLVAVIVALISLSVWIALPTQEESSNGANEAIISNTADTQYFKERPHVVAETEEKANAYAAKLGLEAGQYTYVTSNGLLSIDSNGTWTGMVNTTLIGKYSHLLLPSSVKKLTINRGAALGTTSVRWVSITADEGSQLEEFERGTSSGNSVFGNSAGWLERVDLTNATKLKTIPAWTFYQCDRLYDIALPETLTSIETNAIASKSMVHISLPSGLGPDGSGIHNNAFQGSSKLVEIELPSNASSAFETKVKGMTAVSNMYLNVYKKGTGRSWMVTTSDGFIFCKNLSRTSALADQMGTSVTVEPTIGQISYAINKWYLVGYRGIESGGDALLTGDNYMVTFPKQVDLDINGSDRSGVYDYMDCSGAEVKNDFSSLAGNTATLGSNVAINGTSRIIAGTSNGEKLRYDVGQYAFYYRWVYHITIPDDTVSAIGNYAFHNAPMNTFNCGDVKYIGQFGLRFAKDQQIDLIFYLPSPNPFCASNGFIETNDMKRVFVYRNYADYAVRANYGIGLYARIRDYNVSEGSLKFYTYLVDIVPNVAEWDESANNYKYVAAEDAKIQRLYAGSLSGYNKDLYLDPYHFVRQSDDNWRYDATQILPALTEYTGYSSAKWFTSTAFTTQYTESNIGTAPTTSAIVSLYNVASKGTSVINMYAKKIVTVSLTNKIREYKDSSLQADSTEITGIPASIKGDYTVKVTKYVNKSDEEKTFESIGSVIQEAGVYTIQIQPDAKYGEWGADDVPTMTVMVNKTEIDLGDANIFRVGVTNGADNLNLRPGKEVAGEQATSLYKYRDSWYTDMQNDLGDLEGSKHGLWNSFVRAEGSAIRFSLTLITNVVRDAHGSEGIFTCNFPGTARSESGQYTDQFSVELTEKAKNNYQLKVTNDESRQFFGYPNSDQSIATINKTWYIVRLNNWLTMQGYSGNDAPSYNMTVNNRPSWEFGSANVPNAPTVALGSNFNITFSVQLTSPNGTVTVISNDENGDDISISKYAQYINSSLPVGNYRVNFTVTFDGDDSTRYGRFYQSFSFSVYEKAFTQEEKDAINQLKGATFEYDMRTATATYNRNEVLFDMSKLSSTAKLEDMLGLSSTTKWNTKRVGIWDNSTYDFLFDENFEITYNLNRMWNNSYLDMDTLIKEDNYPMNTPDVYVVYYQLTCKNRESLIDPSNNDRRECFFNVVVYRTLTAPQGIKDIAYTGYEIYPSISYLNGELEFEQAYYEVTFPSGQDNVNTGDKKVILTIDAANAQLYRWEADATKNVAEISYKIVPANNSTIVPLYMADWSWNSEITLDNIIWETQFGNSADYKYALVPVKSGDDDNRETVSDIKNFGTAAAGRYTLIASCPADKVHGNWNEYTQELTITVSPAVNTWIKSPSITSWTWNQYADYDWSSNVSPIELHAIPTYYSTSDISEAGSGRFDFRIYSIKDGQYNVVNFGNDFHFQYAKDDNGNFITTGDALGEGDHFVLPIDVAKTLAALPAGQYYLVATVYSHNNYTGINNSADSFTKGAVPFTILSSNNMWDDTITVMDWDYSEFQVGVNLHLGATKYDTTLKYSITRNSAVVTVEGVRLENITDFSAVAPGSTYTYEQLVAKLGVGTYILRVHGDAASVNDRNGINYLAIDDQRQMTVSRALNTLITENTPNGAFVVNNYTIGDSTDDLISTEYAARFDSEKIGYRISKNGRYIDGLNTDTASESTLNFDTSLTYAQVLNKISQLYSTESGNDFTVWWTTSSSDNYIADKGNYVFTVYLGQNGWVDDVAPFVSDSEYDGNRHGFDKSEIKLTHNIDASRITVQYYVAQFDEMSGQYTRGSGLGNNAPINVGNYLAAVNVPSDEYYRGMSIDLFYRITATDNSFTVNPSIKNTWMYSQLKDGDITIGVPKHEEDDMILQYVVYRVIDDGKVVKDSKDTEERMATLTWELGGGANSNEISFDAFLVRLNALDVGEYKLYITLSGSTNYRELELDPVTLTVTQANNGWVENKEPAIKDKVTQWEWQNESTMVNWTEIATKFGEVSVYINGNAVATLAVARYLSTMEVSDSHTIRFVVDETNNYKGLDETRTFKITKNKNGWSTAVADKPFVEDWTWRGYDNSKLDQWKQPKFNLGENTATASVYDKKDNSIIRENVGLYALDILFSNLDAGEYYLIWSVADTANYLGVEYDERVDFTVAPAQDKWIETEIAELYTNEDGDSRWTYGNNIVDKYIVKFPKSVYGTIRATILKYDEYGENPEVYMDGLVGETSMENAIRRLGAGIYDIEWSSVDMSDSGNFLEPNNPEKIVINFIVDKAYAEFEGDDPYINSWYWGSYSASYWRAPKLTIGEPYADLYNATSNEKIQSDIPSSVLGNTLSLLNVGRYRLVWRTADGDYGLDPLAFQVIKNRNSWTTAATIEAQWQWQTFYLGRWTRPSPKYHDDDMEVAVYKLNDGVKFEFSDVVGWNPDLTKYTKTNITLQTFDEINNLSVGQYIVQITVPEDIEGNYAGLSKWLQFKIVPNQNEFTYNNSSIASYKYGEFNGSWRAPMSQFGEIKASVYRLENGVRVEKIDEVFTYDLNDVLRDLHTGNYQLDWTITEDENGNYLSHTATNTFAVLKANNRWLSRPAIRDWGYGLYDPLIVPTALPYAKGEEDVYFKIVSAGLAEIADFRAFAEKFSKDANGNYYDGDKLVLTKDGYFTDMTIFEDVMSSLKPGTYHLVAYYPEMQDYYRLDMDVAYEFEVRFVENRWIDLPTIKSWIAGSTPSTPYGSAIHGDVVWTYYKAVYDEVLGKYVISGEAIATDGDNPPQEAGKYMLVADTKYVEGYAQLHEEIFFEIFEQSLTGVSGNLLLWIDIILATIASITTIVIIYTLLKARRRKDDDVFNG